MYEHDCIIEFNYYETVCNFCATSKMAYNWKYYSNSVYSGKLQGFVPTCTYEGRNLMQSF
jgi:hypothetical protein